VAAEEDHVAGVELGRPLPPGVLGGDRAQAVAGLVGVVGTLDLEDALEPGVAAVAGGIVGVRVDGLVLGARGDPEAAVLGVRAIEGEPGADQRVGLGDDVERVLVIALAGAAGTNSIVCSASTSGPMRPSTTSSRRG
jgi:hypothetical protein